MRLQSINIENFRSIGGSCDIPLDADVVLIHGLNGAGKTSVLSAIELAATGTIAHLDRARDKGYLGHLAHRGNDLGRVSLSVSGSGKRSFSEMTVDAAGPHGRLLLDAPDASFFTERCFLPQTTLGRLLEIYAPGDKQESQSSLVNFVKSLVGLDDLDALIDGLAASTHINRALKSSPAWTVAQMRSKSLDEEIRTARLSLAEHERELVVSETALARLLDVKTDDTPLDTLADLGSARLSSLEIEDGVLLHSAELQLQAAQATSSRLSASPMANSESADELESKFSTWWIEGDGKQLISRGSEVCSLVGLSSWEPHSAVEQSAVTSAEVSRNLIAVEGEIESRQILDEQVTEAHNRIEQLKRSVADRDQLKELTNVSPDVLQLAELLAIALPLAVGDSCPLCDQTFAGGANALQSHINTKIARLSAQASASLKYATEIQDLTKRLRDYESMAASLSRELSSATDYQALDLRRRALSNAQYILSQLAPLTSRANEMQLAIDERRSLEVRNSRDHQLGQQVLNTLSSIASSLDFELADNTLDKQIDQSIAEVSHRLLRRNEIVRFSDQLEEAMSNFLSTRDVYARASRTLRSLSEEAERSRLGNNEATRRKESASSLRREAERVRSATMRGVFDDNLNRAWSDLFRRLAPREPFVPQFKRDDRASRTVNIELETIDRSGVPAASPGAMLSYGNVNTAALSLFLSLHFAVKPVLPWLILDDPIQSMDDVHVANFAALIKQLTRTRGRQVVIAVHQRELFDYLRFELTPASNDQSLLAVSIEKSDDSSTSIRHERFEYEEDKSITAA